MSNKKGLQLESDFFDNISDENIYYNKYTVKEESLKYCSQYTNGLEKCKILNVENIDLCKITKEKLINCLKEIEQIERRKK